MKNIPTLFARNPHTSLWVTPQVTPGCEWALKGEGTATRMYAGACVMWDGRTWWKRRKIRPGQDTPPDFRCLDYDTATGERIGWAPAHRSSLWPYLMEATTTETGPLTYPPGTYELVGPEIKRNPEGLTGHQVIRHAPKAPGDSWPMLYADAVYGVRFDYDMLPGWLAANAWKGIVWHHPDGRMAKIRRRDFPLPPAGTEPWPAPSSRPSLRRAPRPAQVWGWLRGR